MTHAVLLGARGMLARDLAASAPGDVQVDAFGRSEIDIMDFAAVARVLDDRRPDWVINASAYAQVDRAETDYERALAVNGTAVGTLGELCAARGVRVLHFGTDYIFRGDATAPYRESDAPDPVNAYGRSKLAGEHGLARSGARVLVLRTQWLYGLHGKSFPRTMWERATKAAPTRVVADQVGRPTYTVDLARAVWELIAQDASGTYHVGNAGDAATWFDVADAVFATAGVPALVTPCSTADYPTPARRPAYSVLSTELVASRHGVTLRPWRDALREFLRRLEAEVAG